VRLPHLPLVLWDDSTSIDIGIALRRFVDHAEKNESNYMCAIICVEVNLEKGLPKQNLS
jgi:hypothetical protein